MMCQSLWHTPEAFIFTRTSPALGGSSSHSTTCNGWLGLTRTAAFIGSLPAPAANSGTLLPARSGLPPGPPDISLDVARGPFDQRHHRGVGAFGVPSADRFEHRAVQGHRGRRR